MESGKLVTAGATVAHDATAVAARPGRPAYRPGRDQCSVVYAQLVPAPVREPGGGTKLGCSAWIVREAGIAPGLFNPSKW
jgi:hypothetical protein